MCPMDDLTMACDDLLRGRVSGIPDVVDAFQDDQVARAGLHQYVAIQTVPTGSAPTGISAQPDGGGHPHRVRPELRHRLFP